MKLIIRADDVGYTPTYNMGMEEAVKSGVVTSADLMLDCPGFEDAAERLKKYPFLSIGWHSHFWGQPVCAPKEVPSMVNEKGWFKFRKDQALKDTCDFDEVVKECRSQIERCIRMLGKAPDYTHISRSGPFETARRQVCDEYGIKYGFCTKMKPDGTFLETPAEKYANLDIYMVNQPATIYKCSFDDSMAVRKTYNPIEYYQSNAEDMLSKKICITAWHPGFLDDHILRESSCTEARIVDMIALCSDKLKKWIKDNHVELVNYRDALYGTREYQNHLKATDSSLAIH